MENTGMEHTDDTHTVRPHVLCNGEEVAVATVDGIGALIVPVSEELARGCIRALERSQGIEGMEARPATIEEIEELCAEYGVATVGLFGLGGDGLPGGEGLDVLSVEVVGMVLTRDYG
jgi:hypothetical protein